MRETLEKFLRNLAVNRVLSPYETQPWVHQDNESNTTCSAEVRMGPGGEDIEAEIQLLKDQGDDESDGDAGSAGSGMPQQILWLRAQPSMDGKWAIKSLRIKGEEYLNKFHGWDEKGCEVFRSCVESLQMGALPEIDTLIEEHMKDEEAQGGRGRIGRKSPKVNPSALMGMKK